MEQILHRLPPEMQRAVIEESETAKRKEQEKAVRLIVDEMMLSYPRTNRQDFRQNLELYLQDQPSHVQEQLNKPSLFIFAYQYFVNETQIFVDTARKMIAKNNEEPVQSFSDFLDEYLLTYAQQDNPRYTPSLIQWLKPYAVEVFLFEKYLINKILTDLQAA